MRRRRRRRLPPRGEGRLHVAQRGLRHPRSPLLLPWLEDVMRNIVSRTAYSFVIAIVSLAPGSALAQAPTPPANAAVYEVRFSFAGHLGSLADAPDCPVRRNGTAVMS